jgi:hypothetical protein
VACCTGCDGDKEVKSCPVCGKPVPPSLGYKPRKYCSAKCLRASGQKRKPDSCACEFCGVLVSQHRKGRTKRFCSKPCRLRAAAAKRPKRERVKKERPKATCLQCGVAFDAKKRGQKLCSTQCRNARRAGNYTCLNCEMPFRKKRYPSGSYSCQTKYCSRECAFEARRRRLPAAIDTRRRDGLTNRLVSWFLSWGDDQWPLVAACPGCCGRFYRQRNPNDRPHEKCGPCRYRDSYVKVVRPCDGCGVTIDSARRLCADCGERRFRESRRKSRRARRAKHGNACTFRQRCK